MHDENWLSWREIRAAPNTAVEDGSPAVSRTCTHVLWSNKVKIVSSEPLLFRFANRLLKANVRGSSRLMKTLAAWGLRDVVVEYPLGKIRFGIPVGRNHMDGRELLAYESVLMELFCSRLTGMTGTVLFDCGADIGIFAAVICSRSQAISKVIAFEPSDAFPYMARNMTLLPVQAQAFELAVSNFVGKGRLESPAYDPGHTARFLRPGEGPINVTTVDSFKNFGGNVAIKIDVEGGEIEVLRGASETIRCASKCLIAIEAHPLVVERTGQDTVECLRFLESIRPFQFTVAETGKNISTDQPVLKPGQTIVYNLVCSTT